MHDPKEIDKDPEAFARRLATRGFFFDVEKWKRMRADERVLNEKVEVGRAVKNAHAKYIGAKKRNAPYEERIAFAEKLDAAIAKFKSLYI